MGVLVCDCHSEEAEADTKEKKSTLVCAHLSHLLVPKRVKMYHFLHFVPLMRTMTARGRIKRCEGAMHWDCRSEKAAQSRHEKETKIDRKDVHDSR